MMLIVIAAGISAAGRMCSSRAYLAGLGDADIDAVDVGAVDVDGDSGVLLGCEDCGGISDELLRGM